MDPRILRVHRTDRGAALGVRVRMSRRLCSQRDSCFATAMGNPCTAGCHTPSAHGTQAVIQALKADDTGAVVHVPCLRPTDNIVVARCVCFRPRLLRNRLPAGTKKVSEVSERADALNGMRRRKFAVPMIQQRSRARARLAEHRHLALLRWQRASQRVVERTPLCTAR